VLTLNPNTRLDLNRALVTITHGSIVLGIEPLLTFRDFSPDACWTLFAPPQGFDGTYRPTGTSGNTQPPTHLFAASHTSASMQVDADTDAVKILVRDVLNAPVWSHLNTFTELSLAGHKHLFIEFSPCPGQRIEVRKSDYPFGRPARFAYLDAKEIFHVVEASNAEKGPFHDLASGRLRRTQSLTMTFYDDQTPVFSVTMDDFASQCSTELSPTAGWGVPMNAIEFSLSADAPNAAASVFISLASTSVGRGYDSVGHLGGTYRNRMLVQRIGNFPTTRSVIPE